MIAENIPLSANHTDLDIGRIKFYNNYFPKLPAGEYRVQLTQTVAGDGLEQKVFKSNQEFEVAGPRFTLPEGEIHSVYPPPNGEDDYKGVLPQVVFRKRTLPWERGIHSKAEAGDYQIPWMALLLFEVDEIQYASGGDPKKATRTKAISRETERLLKPPSNYLPPLSMTAGLGDEENCYTIDLKKEDFLAIAPRAKELAYLAHVREVNTDNKEFLGMHADGWFSIMLANRLPHTPPEIIGGLATLKGKKFARNIVHLVSLEGFVDYLEDNLSSGARGYLKDKKRTHVRLASLASWEFYSKPPMESFSKLMENLDVGLLRMETTKKEFIHHPYIKTAFEGGYLPMQYHTRSGEKTMAWYRGPLIPVINEYSPKTAEEDTFFSVEASMIYDDQQGIFDLSQAVAWQIGRLLALNDTHFSQTLLDWKKKVNQQIDELLKRQELVLPDIVKTHSISDTIPSYDHLDLQKVEQLMKPSFATDLFTDNFLEQLAIARFFLEELNDEPSLLEVELAAFPGILNNKAFDALLEQGIDPQAVLVKEILK